MRRRLVPDPPLKLRASRIAPERVQGLEVSPEVALERSRRLERGTAQGALGRPEAPRDLLLERLAALVKFDQSQALLARRNEDLPERRIDGFHEHFHVTLQR